MSELLKHNERLEPQSSRVGTFGEHVAAEFLRVRGYRIIARNFRTPIGRNRKGVSLTGEIDIIAANDDVVCFIEVKSRTAGGIAPESAVNLRKQRQITRTARAYLMYFDIEDKRIRFDVLAVTGRGTKAPKIRHLRDYWNPEKLKIRRWTDDVRFIT